MHACPHFLHSGVVVDSDTLFYVRLLPTGLKQYLPCILGEPSPWPWRDSGRAGHWEGGVHPPFKMPSMQIGSLHHEDMMHDGYRPKMLLFALDELYYIFDQIKKQQRADEKIVVAYEILCLSTQQCTE